MPIDIDRLIENLDGTLQLPCRVKPHVNRDKTHRFCREIYLAAEFGPKALEFATPFPLTRIKAKPVTLDVQTTWYSRSEAVKPYLDAMNAFFDSQRFMMALGNRADLKNALQQQPPLQENQLPLMRVNLVLRLENVYESPCEQPIPLYDLGLLGSQYVDLWGRSQCVSGHTGRLLY